MAGNKDDYERTNGGGYAQGSQNGYTGGPWQRRWRRVNVFGAGWAGLASSTKGRSKLLRPFVIEGRCSLPDLTAVLCAHHGRTCLAAKGLSEFRHIRERSNHAILGDGVRITLHHQALRFRTYIIAAQLAPG